MEAFSRAKILNVIASEFFNKTAGKKRHFFQMLEKSQIYSCKCISCCCFCKGWRVKSDTVPKSKDWDRLK